MHSNWENIFPHAHSLSAEVLEALEATQLTREFHEEVASRQAFDDYCQWYYETADNHRRELQKMRGDINILGWFLRGRSSD